MLKKRIIACLDVATGRVVKGVHFVNLRDAGDPVELAQAYSDEGADEIVFLDITASPEHRGTIVEIVEQTARKVFVPLTVGGGISSVSDAKNLLHRGADKVAINTAAVKRPELITELAEEFGSQAVVLAIDAKQGDVYVNGGRTSANLQAIGWAQQGQKLGAGEILLTSMDTDGVQKGFDVALTRAISDVTSIPVIASGGAGEPAHFVEVFCEGRADAALAASIFHFDTCSIAAVKRELHRAGIPVRL